MEELAKVLTEKLKVHGNVLFETEDYSKRPIKTKIEQVLRSLETVYNIHNNVAQSPEEREACKKTYNKINDIYMANFSEKTRIIIDNHPKGFLGFKRQSYILPPVARG